VETTGKGVISVGEIQDAVMQSAPAELKKMKVTPPSIDVLTDNGRFCNDKGEVDFEVRPALVLSLPLGVKTAAFQSSVCLSLLDV